MFFYKFASQAFFFESSYIRYSIPKWISTFFWFWSCVCFLWPTRWHVKFFWTFRYFRLQSLHLISLIVKSLVCRNSTRFHIESLRKLNYGICTYGKRQRFFCFLPVASFILQSIFLISSCHKRGWQKEDPRQRFLHVSTINILNVFMSYIQLFDSMSIFCIFSILLLNFYVSLNHSNTL